MRMRQGFFIAFIFFLTVTAQAEPIFVGSGGGSAEFYIYYAQRSAQATFQLCLKTPSCRQDLAQPLGKILASQPYSSKILMNSQKQIGAVDFITKPIAGSDIQINQERLWKTDVQNNLVALNYADTFQLLVRAWSFQLGFDPSTTQALPRRLAPFITQTWIRTPWIESMNEDMALVQFQSDPDLLFLEDQSNLPDSVSRALSLSKTFDCQSSTGRKLNPKITGAQAFRWLQTLNIDGRLFVSVMGQVRYQCQTAHSQTISFQAELLLNIPLLRTKNNYDVFAGTDVEGRLQNIRTQMPAMD